MQNFVKLFSQARLDDYANLAQHEANLALIGRISHKIGILEIILRNKIDNIIQRQNPQWLELLPNDLELKNPKELDSARDKVVSSQSLGFWVRVVEHYKIHNRVFDALFLDNLNLKKYYIKNKNRFKPNVCLKKYHKVSVILQLFRLIRNRAFHFENLYKMNKKGPRLSVKIYNKYNESLIVSIQPNKIMDFLNDLIASFDKDLIYYAEK
ncbi:hypothetical protein [Helicobacter sp. 23-1045]